MENFTKSERKQIAKESLKSGFFAGIVFGLIFCVIMIAAIIIALATKTQLTKEFKYVFIFGSTLTAIIFFILFFFQTIDYQKFTIKEEKQIEEKRKDVEKCFNGNCVWVIPIKYKEYEEFFLNMNQIYPVKYYAMIQDEKVSVFFRIGDDATGIKFDETEKEHFFDKYKIKE